MMPAGESPSSCSMGRVSGKAEVLSQRRNIVDELARFGVAKNVGDLAVAVENVHGDEDDAEFHTGQVEIDHLYAVGEVDAEAVALYETAPAEIVRGTVAARVDLAEGEGAAFEL